VDKMTGDAKDGGLGLSTGTVLTQTGVWARTNGVAFVRSGAAAKEKAPKAEKPAAKKAAAKKAPAKKAPAKKKAKAAPEAAAA
jgi:hypothetical protein